MDHFGSRVCGCEEIWHPILSLRLIAITLTFTMTNDQDRGAAVWSQADEATLVRTLAEEKAKGNWNENSPKKVAWTACTLALVDSERNSGGSAKSIQSIKNRWQRVCPLKLSSCMRLSRVYPAQTGVQNCQGTSSGPRY